MEDLRLHALLRKAKTAAIEGIPLPAADLREVERIEADFLNWKSTVEKELLAPPPSVELISDYFTQLTQLLSLRVGLRLPRDGAWQKRFGLEISERVLADLPGLAALNHDRTGSPYYSLVFKDRRLLLSDSLVLGVEAHWLTYSPNEKGFLDLIRLLTFRQLAENLSELRTLLPGHPIPPLNFPGAKGLEEDHLRTIDEPAFRTSLIKTFKTAAAGCENAGVRFHDPRFIRRMTAFLNSSPERPADFEAQLSMALDEAMRNRLFLMLEAQVSSSSLPLSEISSSELERLLRRWLATAQADTVMTELVHAIGQIGEDSLEWDIPLRTELITLIDQRRAEFEAAIPASALSSWIRKTQQRARKEGHTRKKALLAENLLREAAQLQRLQNLDTLLSSSPDLDLLAKIIEPLIQKLQPREKVREALRQIIGAKDYAQARTRHRNMLNRWKKTLSQGKTAFSKEVSPQLAKRLHSRMTAEARKDIEDLTRIGSWFSFSAPFPSSKVTVGNLISHPENRKRYQELTVEKILEANPLLAAEVDVGEVRKQRLADFLGWMLEANQALDRPKRFISASLPFVDQALLGTEQRIRQTAQALSGAKTIADVELIASSAYSQGLVLQAYPEYTIPQREALENLLRPTPQARLSERYIQPYLSWGFGSLLFLEVAKWGLGRVIPFAGLNPLIKAYVRTAIPLTFVETGIELDEILHQRRNAQAADTLFFSSWKEGRSWMSFGEMSQYQTHYELSKWVLAGNLAMDTLLLYYPELHALKKSSLQRLLAETRGTSP